MLNNLKKDIIKKLIDLTNNRPMFLHYDSIGLIYLGDSNKTRLDFLSEVLIGVAEGGGNIIVPAFSYSFCRGEDFDILNSQTTLGNSHEILRSKNLYRRTSDGIFSYLVFGNLPIFNEFFDVRASNDSFGKSSLLSKVLHLDGWIGSVGGVIHSTTEIHHIEKILEVDYRFDKKFTGKVIDKDTSYHQVNTFFCRDLNFYKETLLGSDLTKLYEDLTMDNKLIELNINNDFLLDYVSYGDIFDMTKKNIIENPHYLLSKRDDMFSG